MQQTFPQVSVSVSTFHLQYNPIQTPCANAVVIPNLYICYALHQKAHLSSKTSKKGYFLLHKIYTSSIYIIHVLQSTLGFSDGSGVIRVQNGVPFLIQHLPCNGSANPSKAPLLHLNLWKMYQALSNKAIINDKVDLLNAF